MNLAEYILGGIGGLICLVIFIQDLKGRWIHLLTVLALFAVGLSFRLLGNDTDVLLDLLGTFSFVSVVLGLTWLVLRIRKGKAKFIDGQIGLGDILMFYAVGSWFDPFGYALFFVSGIVLVLIVVLALLAAKKLGDDFPIPLAGLLAAYLLIFAPIYLTFQDQLLDWLMALSSY